MKATTFREIIIRSKHKTPMTWFVTQTYKKTFILHIFCATILYSQTVIHSVYTTHQTTDPKTYCIRRKNRKHRCLDTKYDFTCT